MKTPLKSIKAYCLECGAGSRKEVRLCPILDCPLFSYRFGKNPNRKGIGGTGNLAMLKKPNSNTLKIAEN